MNDLIDLTEEYHVITPQLKTCKIFITQQIGGNWVGSVVYVHKSLLIREPCVDLGREGVYLKCCRWVLDNIDNLANIQPLA